MRYVAGALLLWFVTPAAPQQRPDAYQAALATAQAKTEQGDWTGAAKALEQACPLAPDRRACRSDLALAYFRSGRYPEARSTLERLLRRQESPSLLKLLGSVEESDGRIEEAARALYRAAEIEPSEERVFDLGAFLLKYDAPAEGVKILGFGSAKHPESARIKIAFGVALHASGRSKEAVEAVCAAIDLDPTDPRPIQFLGELYDVSPEMASEVTSRFARLAALHPQNPLAAYYYALSLWKGAGERANAPLDQVEQLLRRAVELDPSLAAARYQLGLLYERLEQWQEAITAHEAAVAAHPAYERAYYRLGLLYQRLGRTKEAQKAFRRHRELRQFPKNGPTGEAVDSPPPRW